MNKYFWIIAIVCAFFLFGCEEKWKRILGRIDQSLLYHNNYDGWKLVREDNSSKWDTKFTIEKNDNDTLKILFFLEAKDGSVMLNEYKKQFPCNVTDTCYLEMNSQDTLFFYGQRNGLKTFEVGEYAYRFTFMKMNKGEREYYLDHEDSLRRVRGNNLPLLPSDE
jgi:hypothetical protein